MNIALFVLTAVLVSSLLLVLWFVVTDYHG